MTDRKAELAFRLEREANQRGWDGPTELYYVCERDGRLVTEPAPTLLHFTDDGHTTETLVAFARAFDGNPALAKLFRPPQGFLGLAHVHEGWGVDTAGLAAGLGLDPDTDDVGAAYAAERERRGSRFIADLPGAIEVRYAQVMVLNAFGLPESVLVMRDRGEEPEVVDGDHGGELEAGLGAVVQRLFAAKLLAEGGVR